MSDVFDTGEEPQDGDTEQSPQPHAMAGLVPEAGVQQVQQGLQPGAPTPEVPEPPRTEQVVHVTDTTQTPRWPSRKHEIVVGGRILEIEFIFGKPTILPFSHAMKFLHIPSFECKHPDGTLIPPLPNIAEQSNSGGALLLRVSQVVAELDELSEDSLVRRCNALSGGERMVITSGRNSMIQFLVNRETRKREAKTSKEGSETDVGGATIAEEPGNMDNFFTGMSGDA